MEITSRWIEAPFGSIHASANQRALTALNVFPDPFISKRQTSSAAHPILDSIERELREYFEGTLKVFKTPFEFPSNATDFQRTVWDFLSTEVPFGQVKSYSEEAKGIGRDKAYRAVANANGQNALCIIVPCHRIIGSDGRIGGYSAGVGIKRWLLEHESRHR